MIKTLDRGLSKSSIESALASSFGRQYCCLTNRGTTAVTAALAALDLPTDSRVVFPAAMCSIPVFSARFAGLEPAFADVALADGNLDVADLERVLKEEAGRARAVVAVHMFGRPDDMERLQGLCDNYGAVLVEDAALAMGAHRGATRAGALARISCLSFVRKMLPLEMGGAVLTDDKDLDRRVRDFVDSLPPAPPSARSQTSAAMKAFHALTGYVASTGWTRANLLAPFEAEFRRLLLFRTDEADWAESIVLEELAALEDVVRERWKRAEVYETVFHHPRLQPLDREGSSLFAYPVRLAGVSAEAFLDFASQQGFAFRRIAYPAIAPVFGARRAFPQARLLEKELMGFPVDDNQPVSSFWSYAEDFARVFQDYLDAEPRLPAFDWEGRLEFRMA
jgi:hypothetical protein